MTQPLAGGGRRSRRAASLPSAAPPGRGRALSVLGAVAVVLLLAGAVDIVAAPAAPAPPPAVEQPPAQAGSWYCPAVAGEGERATLTIAAVGDEPSQVVVGRYGQGQAVHDAPRAVEPGTSVNVQLTDEDAMAPATVRWTGGPAVTTWRVDGDRTASAACEPAPSERWMVAGFNSVRGSVPTLHLFNPFTADAVVRLVFATAEGPEPLALTENVLVAAGGTTSINLRRYQPEVPDLGVVVDVLAGRVIAQGEQRVDPPGDVRGSSGRLMLAAAPAPADSWSFDYAADGDGTESWLTVLNPNNGPAAVEIRVSTPSQEIATIVGEVSVPPGGLSRVELAGVSRQPGFGVTVNVVNDEPVVVTSQTALQTSGRSVVAGGLGAPALSQHWALVGAGANRRNGLISLFNPGPEVATVDAVAQGAPAEWSGVTLEPNTRQILDLADAGADRDSIPVRITSDVPIVAGLRSTAAEGAALRLWLMIGVPQSEWIGPPTRPPVRRNEALSTHVGEAPPDDEEQPLPLLPTEAPSG